MGNSNNMNRRLTLGDTVTYSLGSLGREISNNLIVVFFMAYLTFVIGLNGIVLGVLFCLAKVWDAVNDIIMATWINNTRSKFGRYRPWIFFGTILNVFAIVAMFAPVGQVVSSKVGLYFYYMGIYVLWGMTFTAVDVPFWSMIPTIANSTHERNKVSSLARLIGGFGGFIISTVGTLVLDKLGKYNMTSYLWLAVVAGGIFAVFMMIMLACNKERYELPAETISFKQVAQVFKSNDQVMPYAISYVLFVTGTTIALYQILYIFIYEGEIGTLSYNHYGLFTALACTGQGIAMFFYPWFTKKLRAEKVYGANYFMAIGGMLFLFLIFFLLKPQYGSMSPTATQVINVIIVSLAGSLLMTSNGLNQIGSTVMIANIVDYGEYKTGLRTDSLMFSVQTLLTKFAGAIAMLVLGIGVQVSGLPVVDTVTNTVSGEITTTMMTILRVFMFLIPIPFVVAGYLVYRFKYTLYGEKVEKIKAELDVKHLGQEQAAETAVADGTVDVAVDGVVAEAVAQQLADETLDASEPQAEPATAEQDDAHADE